jgi:hypothetical protein
MVNGGLRFYAWSLAETFARDITKADSTDVGMGGGACVYMCVCMYVCVYIYVYV